jgi:hypothetical protein
MFSRFRVGVRTPNSGLTAKRSTFNRLDMLQGLCDQLPDGDAVPRVEHIADELLADTRFVALGPSQRRGVSGQTYTTRELLDVEHDILARADVKAAPGPHAFAVHDSDLRRVLHRMPSLSDEQRDRRTNPRVHDRVAPRCTRAR